MLEAISAGDVRNGRTEAKCLECPYNRGAKLVPGRGPHKAKIVIIGESPGRTEILEGKPFVGPSGTILSATLADLGIDESEVWITNTISCGGLLSSSKTADKISAAAIACNDRLRSEIISKEPTWVVVMGNVALSAIARIDTNLLPLPLPGILKVAGRRWYSEVLNAWVVAVVHPANLLRSPDGYSLFKDDLAIVANDPIVPPDDIETYTAETSKDALTSVQAILDDEDEFVAIDIETSSLDIGTGYVLSIQLATLYNHVVIPMELVEGNEELTDAINTLLSAKSLGGHNAQFDRKFLFHYGIVLPIKWDSILAAYCLDERVGGHSLDRLACRILGVSNWKEVVESYLPRKKSERSYANLPKDILYHYGALDAVYTRSIFEFFRDKIANSDELTQWRYDFLVRASNVLADLEFIGVRIDVNRIPEIEQQLLYQEQEIAEKIQELVGWNINPGAPQQLMKYFYRELKLPKQYQKGKLTTNDDALKVLSNYTPVAALVKKFRSAKKMRTTYVSPLPDLVDSNNRVHTTFGLYTTVTGRLSSKEPNVQNVPRVGPYRELYIASPGYVILNADYSQIELRVLAKLSGDPYLQHVYANGLDMHGEMAAFLFGPAFDKEQRTAAKTLNYALVYGRTPQAVAKDSSLPAFGLEDAERFVNQFHKRLSVAYQFLEAQGDEALHTGVLSTPFGMHRRFPLITPEIVDEIRRQGSNFKMQSIASDLTLMSLVELHDSLGSSGARILLTVHDNIVMEVPERTVAEVARKTIDVMVNVAESEFFKGYIPAEVEVSIGPSWGQLKEIVLDAQSERGFRFL